MAALCGENAAWLVVGGVMCDAVQWRNQKENDCSCWKVEGDFEVQMSHGQKYSRKMFEKTGNFLLQKTVLGWSNYHP